MHSKIEEDWQKTLDILKTELSEPSFNTWLKKTKAVTKYNNTFVIAVPNGFAKDWLESRYANLIKNTLQLVTSEELEVSFVLPQANGEIDYLLKKEINQINISIQKGIIIKLFLTLIRSIPLNLLWSATATALPMPLPSL